MKYYTVGFIWLAGWLGVVCSYHLPLPQHPQPPRRSTKTTTPKPTTSTIAVEYEAPEIEGPVSTTTTTTPAPTTTTTRHPGPGHGHYPYGTPPGGYYDRYGLYHYQPHYGGGGPYSGPHEAYGTSPFVTDPYYTKTPYGPSPSPGPYGSQYASQYDPHTGQYGDPYYASQDPYYGRNSADPRGSLKPSGRAALLNQFSVTKPSPSPTYATTASSPWPQYGHSGKWIEMRGISDLRVSAPRTTERTGYIPRNLQPVLKRQRPTGLVPRTTERTGYIPRNEQPILKRQRPTASGYVPDAYSTGSLSSGTSQINWNNQHRSNSRQNQQQAYSGRGQPGVPDIQANPSSWGSAQSGSSGHIMSSPTRSHSVSSGTYPSAATAYNGYPTNTAYTDRSASQNTVFPSAHPSIYPSVYPSVYPSSASAQTQSSNYYAGASNQGGGMNNFGGTRGSNAPLSANAHIPGYATGVTYSQGSGQYAYNTGGGGMTDNNPETGYNSMRRPGQMSYNDPIASNTGTAFNSFGFASQGPSYNANIGHYNSQPSEIYKYDTGYRQGQQSGSNKQASWQGRSNQGQQNSWSNSNDAKVAQPNTISDVASGYKSNTKTGSRTQDMLNVPSSGQNQASNPYRPDPIQMSHGMETAIKIAIVNAAHDIKNSVSARSYDTVTTHGGTQVPTTTSQPWTAPPTTVPPSSQSQWNRTTPSTTNYYLNYQTTASSVGGAWGFSGSTAPKISFLGARSRMFAAPRTTPNPMKGLNQWLLMSSLFNKK